MSDWRAAWRPVVDRVGQELGDGAIRYGVDRVEAGAIRRWLEPLEFDCALHHDADVARAHGHSDILAPCAAIRTFTLGALWRPGDRIFTDADRNAQPERSNVRPRLPPDAPPVTGYFATNLDIEYLKPVLVGERLGLRGEILLSCEPKETRVGRGAFCTFQSEIVDAAGEAVARTLTTLYLYEPHRARRA